LQGCEPPWRLSEPVVRLSRVYIPGEESVGKGASGLCVLPARRQSEGVDVHQPNSSALGASSSQRQVPAGPGRDVQPVHSRLGQLLQPLLQDAVASTLKRIDLYVIRWARRKFKRLRRKTKGARDWFDRLRRVNPTLFAHWQLCHGNGRTSGAV